MPKRKMSPEAKEKARQNMKKIRERYMARGEIECKWCHTRMDAKSVPGHSRGCKEGPHASRKKKKCPSCKKRFKASGFTLHYKTCVGKSNKTSKPKASPKQKLHPVPTNITDLNLQKLIKELDEKARYHLVKAAEYESKKNELLGSIKQIAASLKNEAKNKN